jgi:3-deoxy-manno-octulosonate cytidylyltransferase (CMP-KDO synthetase)
MIVHVWRRATEAEIGPVVVACADQAIASAVEAAGGRAVMTRPDHPSGSDRAFEALQTVDEAGAFDAVVNVGCDVLTLEPNYIHQALAPLDEAAVDIGTIAAEITDPAERGDPAVVKAVVALKPGAGIGRALYFSRTAVPAGDGPLYHHIGLYAFRRAALERFVAWPPGPLEQRERLEQLRALEGGMRIDVAFVDTTPLHVNTPADLARARALLKPASGG